MSGPNSIFSISLNMKVQGVGILLPNKFNSTAKQTRLESFALISYESKTTSRPSLKMVLIIAKGFVDQEWSGK